MVALTATRDQARSETEMVSGARVLAGRDAVRRMLVALVVFAGLLGALAAFGASPSYADEFTINTKASGIESDCEKEKAHVDACTFEDAVKDADANSNASTITFDLGDVTRGQIQEVSAGTSTRSTGLAYPTTIDRFSQHVEDLLPGTPPSSLGDTKISLSQNADQSIIRGLQVSGFPSTSDDAHASVIHILSADYASVSRATG